MSLYPGTVTDVVVRDGVRTTVHDSPEPPGSTGSVPLVLVHGTGGRTATHFATLFPMLASRRRVLGIDLSDAAADGGDLTLDGLADQVEAVLDARVPAGPVGLLGYSLGSCVAAATAARRGAGVETLVLLNGWARTDNALRLRFELWRHLFDTRQEAALAEFTLLNLHSPAYVDSIPYIGPRPWSQVQEMLAAWAPGPGSRRQVELNTRMDLTGVLPRITARTLVIGSTEDAYVPYAHSRELFGAVPQAVLAPVGGGHASVIERPAELLHLVDRFLRDPLVHAAGHVVDDPVVRQLADAVHERHHLVRESLVS